MGTLGRSACFAQCVVRTIIANSSSESMVELFFSIRVKAFWKIGTAPNKGGKKAVARLPSNYVLPVCTAALRSFEREEHYRRAPIYTAIVSASNADSNVCIASASRLLVHRFFDKNVYALCLPIDMGRGMIMFRPRRAGELIFHFVNSHVQ